MNSLIKNFSQWRAVYEAENLAQPFAEKGGQAAIKGDEPLSSEREKALATIGTQILSRLCLTLLAKSEAITNYKDPEKDVFLYFSTAPFIETSRQEPLNPNQPTTDPEVFGNEADQVAVTANLVANSLKKNGSPVAPIDKVDFSGARKMLDDLAASSGKRPADPGFGKPALQHPLFIFKENRLQDERFLELKNPAFDGGYISKTGGVENSNGFKVSLSQSAADSLTQIVTEIVNAVVPANLQKVRDAIMKGGANYRSAMNQIQKQKLTREYLVNKKNDAIMFPRPNPACTIKAGAELTPPTAAPAPNQTGATPGSAKPQQ